MACKQTKTNIDTREISNECLTLGWWCWPSFGSWWCARFSSTRSLAEVVLWHDTRALNCGQPSRVSHCGRSALALAWLKKKKKKKKKKTLVIGIVREIDRCTLRLCAPSRVLSLISLSAHLLVCIPTKSSTHTLVPQAWNINVKVKTNLKKKKKGIHRMKT